jgi:hypothetical protein
MEIKRIKFKDFLTLSEDEARTYTFAISFAKQFRIEEDTLKIGDVYQLPFGLIKDFQQDLEGGNLNFQLQMDYVKRINPKLKMYNMWLDELCRGLSYMTTSICNLIETERELLGGQPDPDHVAAGLDRFNQLGVYLQLRELAGHDILKIDDIKKVPYEKCFLELYTRKQEADFKKDLMQVMKNKNKS